MKSKIIKCLTTPHGVLDWAENACTPSNWDDETAKFIAECVRLRLAFEAAESEMHNLPLGDANRQYGDSTYNHAQHWLRPLRQAIGEKSK